MAGDYDNDGDLDLFLNGADAGGLLLINESTGPGNFTWSEYTAAALGAGDGEGTAFFDYDNDGDLDLYINQTGANELWRNNLDNKNYLMVRALRDLGGGTTRPELGATIVLRDWDGNVISGVREVNGSRGHGSQDAAIVHFGLPQGPDTKIYVEVSFLDGSTVTKAVIPSSLGSYQVVDILNTDSSDAINRDPIVNDDTGVTDEVTVLSVAAPGVLGNDAGSLQSPTSGAWLSYDAAADNPGDNLWTSTTGEAGFEWDFGTNDSPIVPVTGLPGITAAYSFPTAGGSGAIMRDVNNAGTSGNSDEEDATFEFWFRPSDVADQDVIFETGSDSGGGVSFTMRNDDGDGLYDDLNFSVIDGGVWGNISVDLSAFLGDPGDGSVITSEFIHVVGVLEVGDGVAVPAQFALYINGTAAGTLTTNGDLWDLIDWATGDDSGLGQVNGTIAAAGVRGDLNTDYTDFEGEIARFGFYDNKAFTPAEAQDNYDAVAEGLYVSDVEGSPIAQGGSAVVVLASGAQVTMNSDGSYDYDPNGAFAFLSPGESTTDSFNYSATDPFGNTATATVTITVNGTVNDPPVVNDQSFSVDENSPNGTSVDTVVATDPDEWFDAAWSFRKAITIDSTKVSADLTDFPVLISLV
ncbi:MAG: hypothetical protein GWN21_15380, partial [Gammaproteobacteria bacterium]|nr:hypothetical protein [Gammaproteobacteria bacterium]NIR21894.1 hypothetical protein [Gammaproteobacteria bacterium]NIS03594.1 hypothetical protein [Gammaproteobacteria bacterium]NIU40342.1 hypothetical protein [Gammaproteobacteria bacterium]NIV45878.1 hypothetical protein [Gammaproteobacteria bacterium]